MKRFISILLVMTMLLSFAACNKNKGPESLQQTVPLDIEVLKNDWKTGELVFANGNSVELPCKVSEFVEKTGLEITNADAFSSKTFKAKETFSLYVAGEGVNFSITARNNTGEDGIGYLDATVVKYNFNNTNSQNNNIKFVGTLTMGVTRSDVEKALGKPEGQTKEDKLYLYEARNEKNRRVELVISFNSYDIVNSVSFEIKY